LYLAFELGEKEWKLGFTIGLGQKPRERTMAAGEVKALPEAVRLAKKRFDWPDTTEVKPVRQRLRLGGLGENSAWLYTMEFFSWRANGGWPCGVTWRRASCPPGPGLNRLTEKMASHSPSRWFRLWSEFFALEGHGQPVAARRVSGRRAGQTPRPQEVSRLSWLKSAY
jgi:hypothetical protein